MEKPGTTPDFRKPIVAFIIGALALGASWWGGILESQSTANKIKVNTSQISQAKAVALVSFNTALAQKAVYHNVCYRFNADEALAVQQSFRAYQTEKNAAKTNIEVFYHEARMRDAMFSYTARKKRNAINCDKAMGTHPLPSIAPDL